MLNDPVPAQRYVWKLDLAKMTGTLAFPNSRAKSITVPLDPMLGRVATAPPGEQSWDALWPGEFGGNMDVPDVKEGATVYLPIFHPGALFYFGDGHALQGDGEVCGSGLETSMDVTFEFGLLKNKKIAWPRIENSEYIMATGSVRPLMDAFRIAHIELILWLVHDYGFDKWEALQLVSQLATARVGNAVDPNYCVAAKFPKKYLPR
jgi:acetamidase/formamidase